MRWVKIFAFLVCLLSITFIGTCLVLSYAVYDPQNIARYKMLSRVTNVDFPKYKVEDWVLAEGRPGNCYYWIQAVFEELPNEEFYASIENLICEGNEFWKIEGDKYVFQKKEIYIAIKKNAPGICIDIPEFLFVWE